MEGVLIFLNLKFFNSKKFSFKNYGLIHLRNGTSDVDFFNQVFLDLEYNIYLNFLPKIIVDAGANIGLTSLYFSNKYPHAKIISIEPENENFKFLELNTQLHKNISVMKKALWCDAGYIYLDKKLSNDSHQVSVNGIDTNKIETVTVQDIICLNSIDKIDILKIDVEGAEKEIFSKNYSDWLPKVKYLIVEQHDRLKSGCIKSLFSTLNNCN